MNHKLLFNEDIIHNFDFSDEYVGYVIDNSDFENDLTIKVFVPELFGYAYVPLRKPVDTKIDLSTSHILNKESLQVTSSLYQQEYLTARLLVERKELKDKENFFLYNKPDIGGKVIVQFFNHNPNNCIFLNSIFLSDEEEIFNNIKYTSNSNNQGTLVWEY